MRFSGLLPVLAMLLMGSCVTAWAEQCYEPGPCNAWEPQSGDKGKDRKAFAKWKTSTNTWLIEAEAYQGLMQFDTGIAYKKPAGNSNSWEVSAKDYQMAGHCTGNTGSVDKSKPKEKGASVGSSQWCGVQSRQDVTIVTAVLKTQGYLSNPDGTETLVGPGWTWEVCYPHGRPEGSFMPCGGPTAVTPCPKGQ